jgi:hypothetical protein
MCSSVLDTKVHTYVRNTYVRDKLYFTFHSVTLLSESCLKKETRLLLYSSKVQLYQSLPVKSTLLDFWVKSHDSGVKVILFLGLKHVLLPSVEP